MTLSELLSSGRRITAIGFDDGPFERRAGAPVPLAGVVCSNTRFEGLLWGQTERDGLDATGALIGMLRGSKFERQVHVLLTDGLAVGGLNVLDLPELHRAFGIPCIAVMRRVPDLERMGAAISRLPHPQQRLARLQAAGPVHTVEERVFQAVGCSPQTAAAALSRLTDRGKVPEPLRLAHLIGAAVVTGESGRRA